MLISRRRLLVSFAVLLALIPSQANAQGRKRALLVGVKGYALNLRQFTELNTERDLEALRSTLKSRFAFSDADIQILKTPQTTTRKAILSAFRSWLIDSCEPGRGDIVYFHFSGHGSQVPAKNDPDEPDGLDQTIVPSDYGPNGTNHILDDEIADLLNQLKAKQPASIMLSFDCCHSGTVTRGGGLVRGRRWDGPIPPPKGPRARGMAAGDGAGGLFKKHEAYNGGFVVFSACRADQVDTEIKGFQGQPMGPLSYALSKAMQEAAPDWTYHDLFQRVTGIMAQSIPTQTPQLEGDLRKVVMTGIAKPAAHFYEATVDPKGVHLKVGELHGVTKGSKYDLYRVGTTDFKGARPIARAIVASVNDISAELTVQEGKLDPSVTQAVQALESAHNFGENRLRLDVSEVLTSAAGKALVGELASPAVELQTAPAASAHLRLRALAGGSRALEWTLFRAADGALVRRIPVGPAAGAAVREAVEGEARWRFVKDLDNRDPNSLIGVKIRIIPVEVEPVSAEDKDPTRVRWVRDLDPAAIRTDGGQYVLKIGQYIRVELLNTGENPVYVTLLDLDAEGRINALWPALKTDNNKLPVSREWQKLSRRGRPAPILVTKPTGTEIFKAIATLDQTDFSSLVSKAGDRGLETREARSPLGRLLRSAALGRSTRSTSTTEDPDPANWATATFVFTVVDPAARTVER